MLKQCCNNKSRNNQHQIYPCPTPAICLDATQFCLMMSLRVPKLKPWAWRSCSSRSRPTRSGWEGVSWPGAACSNAQTRPSPPGSGTEPCSCPARSQSPALTSGGKNRNYVITMCGVWQHRQEFSRRLTAQTGTKSQSDRINEN